MLTVKLRRASSWVGWSNKSWKGACGEGHGEQVVVVEMRDHAYEGDSIGLQLSRERFMRPA